MCDHNTTVTIYSGKDTEVELCEWGCDKILIYARMPDGKTVLVKEVENPLRIETDALKTFPNIQIDAQQLVELHEIIKTSLWVWKCRDCGATYPETVPMPLRETPSGIKQES
jgi:hypothetical protein